MRFKLGYTIAAIATVALAPIAASAHDNGYNHYHQRSSNGDNQVVGGAIGAVAGAVIGSQLAGNGARTEGSVLGAVVGGVAGAAIAGNNNGRQVYRNGGYYNQNTGYYGGYNNGYHNPNYRTTYRRTYTQPVYSRPVYSRPVYGGHSYYPRNRAAININLGNGGFYGHRRGFNYGHRGYRNRGHHFGHRNRHGHKRYRKW